MKMHYTVIDLLLKKGADIEKKNKFGSTPFILRKFIINFKAMKFLNSRNFSKCLVSENCYESLDAFRFLLSKGANINAIDNKELSALHNVGKIKF